MIGSERTRTERSGSKLNTWKGNESEMTWMEMKWCLHRASNLRNRRCTRDRPIPKIKKIHFEGTTSHPFLENFASQESGGPTSFGPGAHRGPAHFCAGRCAYDKYGMIFSNVKCSCLPLLSLVLSTGSSGKASMALEVIPIKVSSRVIGTDFKARSFTYLLLSLIVFFHLSSFTLYRSSLTGEVKMNELWLCWIYVRSFAANCLPLKDCCVAEWPVLRWWCHGFHAAKDGKGILKKNVVTFHTRFMLLTEFHAVVKLENPPAKMQKPRGLCWLKMDFKANPVAAEGWVCLVWSENPEFS